MRSGRLRRGARDHFKWFRSGLLALAFWLIAGHAAFAAVSVTPTTLPAGTLSVPYDETVSGNGGTGPYTFAVTSGSLPTGLSLNGTTGEITGTPSTQGVYNFTIQATDSLSATGSRAYTVSVGTFSLAVQPNTLPNGTRGTAYNQTLTAVGGNPPYTFAVSSGALPTGLTLDPSGALSGTPTGSGTSTFIVQAQDANGDTGYRTYNISIGTNSLTFTPATLPNGTQGTAYNQSVTASGGTGGPYTYSVSSGALPSGLSLNTSNGAITGTPTSSGSSSFTIHAVDGNNNYGSQNYTIQIGGSSLTVNPASLPNGMVSTTYNQTVTATGGTGGPYTYSITSGSLPTGLSLNAGSGAITGTPSAGGAYTFNVHAVDGNSNFGDRSYTVNIGTNSLTVTPSTLPNGTQAVAYNQTVGATGGTGPYTFAVTSGALPTGLSLNASSGAISGTPSASGTYNFTIRATDANSNTGSQAYAVTIAPAPLTVSPTTLQNGTQGAAYNQTVTTSGGTGPYSYAVTSGSLPTGLSLNANSGAITGTPSAAGNYNFTIQSTDSTSNTGSRAYSVNIGTNSLTLNPPTLANGTQGTAYNQTVVASGGSGPYTYAVTSGALPTGLSLNTGSGAITGTPSGNGASSFTVQATDANGNTGSRAYNVNIGTNSLAINPASLPSGSMGIAYNQSVLASSGTGPYSYAVASGALPAGLSLNPNNGAITGTPTGSGASAFTIKATDANGNIGSRAYNVNVGTSTLAVNPATLPNGSQGIAYNQTVAATGGTGPYTYTLSSGALPAGLSLNANSGAITGTPTGNGTSAFTIMATDTKGNTGSRAYNINIGNSTLSVNPGSMPAGSQGSAYSQTMTASGGTGPYTLALISGTLPAGLTFNSASGAITGTPTGSGVSTFVIRAIDANGNFGTRSFSLSIGSNSLTINPASIPPAMFGKAYNQTLSVSGGTAPYTYSLQSGALPPGISLSGGAITGTPTSEGSFTFVVLVHDVNGNFGTRSYSLSTARPDPSTDPDVMGLVASQAATARRFTDAQTTNVMRHLEGLHGNFNPCGLDLGISASSATAPVPVYAVEPAPISKDPYPPSAQPQSLGRPVSPAVGCDPLSSVPIAVWAGGALEFGKATTNGLIDSSKFSTQGVTAGIDVRVADPLIVGAAVGLGLDHTDIGLRGTISNADTLNGMMYASYKPTEFLYLDALAGYGGLDFNNSRWVALDNTSVSGARQGNTWFGSLGVSYDVRQGMFKFSPYARLDAMTARLNQYSETGDVSQALTFQSTSFSSTAGVVGLRGSVDIIDDLVTVTPNARVEYKRALDRGFTQSMFYNEIGAGNVYAINQDSTTRDIFTGAVGLRTRFGSSGTFELEYILSGTPSRDVSWQSQMIRAMAHWTFVAN